MSSVSIVRMWGRAYWEALTDTLGVEAHDTDEP